MKILVANIGSTSLKWRLFDFADHAERLLHKGGFERVTDYPKAIEDCLAELKQAKVIASESELSAVGFKTVWHRRTIRRTSRASSCLRSACRGCR